MPLVVTLWDLVLFSLATFGFGSAVAPRRGTDPLLRFAVGTVAALGFWFVGGFGGFVLGVSNRATAAFLALLAVLIVGWRHRCAAALWHEPIVREFAGSWLAFASWGLGLLALVRTYSGGGWAGDWAEHWQRAVFFLEREPLTTRFIGLYSLTARPPLVNLLVALGLEGSTSTFAHYQVFMTLFGTLVLLPAWILARRWSPAPETGRWVTLVLMLSPVVAQNLTFAWTKLPTAFFVLSAICVLLHPPGATGIGKAATAGVCLGLGMVSHYSAGPWAVAIVVAIAVGRWRDWRSPALWRETAVFGAAFALVMGGWLAWAGHHFGWAGALADNTSAQAWQAQSNLEKLAVIGRNLFATLVPFPLRGEPADGLIVQASRLGRLRDVAFNVYQISLLPACGLGGLWIFASRLTKKPSTTITPLVPRVPTSCFYVGVPAAIVLGIAVHAQPDAWGLAHICLQPLVVIGLAGVAATLAEAAAGARIIWAMFASVDVLLGIALHFGLQSWALARWIAPSGEGAEWLGALNRFALRNAVDKARLQVKFFADEVGTSLPSAVLILLIVLGWVVIGQRKKLGRLPQSRR